MGRSIRKYVRKAVKRAAKDPAQLAMDEVNGLVKKLERLHRKTILTEAQKNEIQEIRAQNAMAKKGAEESYKLTQLDIMKKYLTEEINVYEGEHQTAVGRDERAPARGAEGVAS